MGFLSPLNRLLSLSKRSRIANDSPDSVVIVVGDLDLEIAYDQQLLQLVGTIFIALQESPMLVDLFFDCEARNPRFPLLEIIQPFLLHNSELGEQARRASLTLLRIVSNNNVVLEVPSLSTLHDFILQTCIFTSSIVNKQKYCFSNLYNRFKQFRPLPQLSTASSFSSTWSSSTATSSAASLSCSPSLSTTFSGFFETEREEFLYVFRYFERIISDSSLSSEITRSLEAQMKQYFIVESIMQLLKESNLELIEFSLSSLQLLLQDSISPLTVISLFSSPEIGQKKETGFRVLLDLSLSEDPKGDQVKKRGWGLEENATFFF